MVKNRLVEALNRQTSPMVQIALIDLLVELGEKRSIQSLRRLAADDKTNQYVRQKAEWGLKQMS
jgi:HEAT repeat protein